MRPLAIVLLAIGGFIGFFIVLGFVLGVVNVMQDPPRQVVVVPGVELGGTPTADEPLLVENRQAVLPRQGSDTVRFGVYYAHEQDAQLGSEWTFTAGNCRRMDGSRTTPVELVVHPARYTVDRQITTGDIMKFQTGLSLEPSVSVEPGEVFSCVFFVDDDSGNRIVSGPFVMSIV